MSNKNKKDSPLASPTCHTSKLTAEEDHLHFPRLFSKRSVEEVCVHLHLHVYLAYVFDRQVFEASSSPSDPHTQLRELTRKAKEKYSFFLSLSVSLSLTHTHTQYVQ